MERNFNSETELKKLGGTFFDFGQAQHYKWLLPVYFKQKDYSDVSAEVTFIEVNTTSIAPCLTIDSSRIDFGEVAVGTRSVREVTIRTSGLKALLKRKPLPIFCSFNVLNSLREV